MRPLILSFLSLLLSSSALASTGLAPLTLVEETEHFRFLVGPSSEGRLKIDARGSEKAYRELSAQLGVTLDRKIEYQRLEFPEQVAIFSGDASLWTTGVAHSDTLVIQSVLPSHPHEVVHLLSSRLGQPSTFFVEGLAVALGDRGKLNGWSVDELARPHVSGPLADRAVASFKAVDPMVSYALAGSFTRFIVKKWGLPRLVEFFSSSRDGGRDEAQVFQQAFGVSLSDALVAWKDGLR